MKSSSVKLGVILVIGVTIFNYGTVLGEEKYLCVVEQATGFAYDENSKTWVGTKFKADSKYIISKSDDKEYRFKVTKVGEDHSTCECKEGFNEYGYLLCECWTGQFKFNKNNGRFIMAHPFGYYNVLPGAKKFTDKNSDTPFMEIGKCSPF